MKSYYIHLDFEEFAAETYRAVQLYAPDDTVTHFATGDPLADFTAAQQAARNTGKALRYLSFVEHFGSDSLFYTLDDDGDDDWKMRLTTQAERVKEVKGWLDNLHNPAYGNLMITRTTHAPDEIQWALGRNLLSSEEAQALTNLLTSQAQAIAA